MDSRLDAFLKILDGADSTTGGGAASAVAGAMAAGLASMVARLSMSKQDLASDDRFQAIAERCQNLSESLFAGGRDDSAAFAKVSQAYKLPKQSEQEKAARSQAIQAAMLNAARVPLANAKACRETLSLCRELHKGFNQNAASDLECALHLAGAGLKGCAANVKINIPYIKDEATRRELERELAALEAE